jgi:hypothetical protein
LRIGRRRRNVAECIPPTLIFAIRVPILIPAAIDRDP